MSSRTILVVDDEEDILELLDYNLTKEGFRVVRAATGEKALDLARTERPDLIVLDLMLPSLDGLEVCKHVRTERSTANIPIVMLSPRFPRKIRLNGRHSVRRSKGSRLRLI